MEQKRRVRAADGVEERETGRVEAFSDGVFAIAVTLLILGIAVPLPLKGNGLLTQVGDEWPSFLAYVLSFVTILIMWVNHHNLFKIIRRTDQAFLIINGLLLMLVTFVNYPTALLAATLKIPPLAGTSPLIGTYSQKQAALIYSGTFVLIAVLYNVLWHYAKREGRLLARDHDRELVELITRQYRFGPLFYLIAFLFAFISAPASIVVNILLAIYYMFTATCLLRRSGGRLATEVVPEGYVAPRLSTDLVPGR